MKSFVHLRDIAPAVRVNEHGGNNKIFFRRLWTASDFASPIDFVDFTIIPPNSTIGLHSHIGSEEAYFIASGSPIVRVADDVRRLSRGDVSVVHSGQSHELINDTACDVEILVFQVQVPQR